MVALDDGPAVDGEDVPLLQAVGARDAVDDHVVGRGADDGREAVVAQEVRGGAPPLEHGPGHGVELGRGHPGLGGGPGVLVHLGHHLAGLAHLGQLLVVAPHRSRLSLLAAVVDGPDDPAGHRVGRAGAVDGDQEVTFGVPGDERCRLGLVEVETALDGLLGVVLALDHLAAADVAGPVDHGRRRGGVVGAAVDADPPRRQPLHDQGGRHLEVDDQVQAEGVHDLVEVLGLGGRPGAPVEHEAAAPGVALGEAAPHHLHDHVVGDQLALVHERLGPDAQRRVLDFTSPRSMSPVETWGTT